MPRSVGVCGLGQPDDERSAAPWFCHCRGVVRRVFPRALAGLATFLWTRYRGYEAVKRFAIGAAVFWTALLLIYVPLLAWDVNRAPADGSAGWDPGAAFLVGWIVLIAVAISGCVIAVRRARGHAPNPS